MFVRTGLAADRLAGGEHPAAADLALASAAPTASSWPPGRPASRSLKASSSPEIPVSVPGGKPCSASSRACARLGAPTSPTTASAAVADAARRGRALGERRAVGGEDRAPARGARVRRLSRSSAASPG